MLTNHTHSLQAVHFFMNQHYLKKNNLYALQNNAHLLTQHYCFRGITMSRKQYVVNYKTCSKQA